MGMPSSASRDMGLERIGRTTRYLAVGGLLAGGVLSGAVAEALPGHSNRSSSSPSSAGTPATTPSTAAPSDDSSGQAPATTPSQNLTPPTRAPQPTYQAPVASSGGS